MAVYYIDPHLSTTGGSGTWASPWTFQDFANSSFSNTNNVIGNGDEIRIKGVALTSLLTATTYTGTIQSNQQYRLYVSNASDFSQWDIVYFPDTGVFSKVYSVNTSSNYIDCYSNAAFPHTKPFTNGGTVSFRKVDTTTYPNSGNWSYVYFWHSNQTLAGDSITISDCWTADGTRVTDGTVKTLVNNVYTSNQYHYWFDNNYEPHVTFDMPNTTFVNGNTSSGDQRWYFRSNNSTINIGFIQNWYQYGSPPNWYGDNNTYNFKYYYGRFYLYASNSTANIDYYYVASTNYGLDSVAFSNATLNIDTYFVYNASNSFIELNSNSSNNVNFNVKKIDFRSSNPQSYALMSGANAGQTLLDSANFDFIWNNNQYSISGGSTVTINAQTKTNQLSTPAILALPGNIPASGMNFNGKYDVQYVAYEPAISAAQPNVYTAYYPEDGTNTQTISHYGYQGGNSIVAYLDNSNDPVEYLGVLGSGYTGTSNTYYPIAQRDFTTYRTSSPSVKINLPTYYAQVWSTGGRSKKVIKIPVVENTQITVTGYIRTNDASVATGDIKAELIVAGAVAVSDSMTSACYNAWEQFSLTYIPTFTGELNLAISIAFTGANTVWFDDIAVA